MISCNVKGGLGNQLFQIAATYALAIRNNDICGFDLSDNKYKNNILSKVNSVKNFKPFGFYDESNFYYKKIKYSKNMILNGYFQSEKYFLDFKEEIINLFVISNENVKIINDYLPVGKSITSVHVRRGDYKQHLDYFHLCDINYFNKCMELIGDSFFIFISDDINWCKENFGNNSNCFFPNFNSDVLDFTLMTICDNNIMSNSTFSWWGSYLNKNSKVYAPKKWFNFKGPVDVSDLYRSEWILV